MGAWVRGVALGALVTHVCDGDTIVVRWVVSPQSQGIPVRVRLARIQAPELYPYAQPGAVAAAAALRVLVEGRLVIVTPVQAWPDRYGRMVAEVQVSGVDVSSALLEAGLVVLWRSRRQARADLFRRRSAPQGPHA